VFLAILLAALLAACDAEATPPPSAAAPVGIVGPTWIATSIRGVPVAAESAPTITFASDQVRGTGACNDFGGGYRFDPATGQIRFDALAVTARGCLDEQRTATDTAFFQAISGADRLFLDEGGQLHLIGSGGAIVFVKRPS
jgi:heat shock protein HslJ